ncbi:18202_t:CDS:2, partial [Gigaspora rosea]
VAIFSLWIRRPRISVISSLSVSLLKVDPLLPVVGVEVIFAVDITGVAVG